MSTEPTPPVIAIVGATGVGKSDAAVQLAHRLNGEVINADSMQVYRGMDIGTAKLSAAERGGIPHHLIDVWEVAQESNVARYQASAREAVRSVQAAGRVPIVVGGSGLYVNAVIDDLRFPGHDPQVRARLIDELDRLGPQAMHARLRALDPQAAAAVLPSNGRRIVRALEVWEITGAAPRTRMPQPRAVFPVVMLGLTLDQAELDQRLIQRVQLMWERGFVEEVQALAPRLREAPTARFALGYRQILEHLDGERTHTDAIDATVRATRKFSRRQNSWFGRDQRIEWLDVTEPDLLDRLSDAAQQGISRVTTPQQAPRLYP